MDILQNAKKLWFSEYGRWTTFGLLGALYAAKLLSEFLHVVPPVVTDTIIAILLVTAISLLFEIHEKTSDRQSERAFRDHNFAQAHMNDLLVRLAKQRGDPRKQIRIQIIGVALSYSLPWINKGLRSLLKECPSLAVGIEACMISERFLKGRKFDREQPNDWPKTAEMHLDLIKRHVEKSDKAEAERLTIAVHVYENLPHWHGVLIDEEHLYLCRANWEDGSFDDPAVLPKFTVGQNKYRYYHVNDAIGGDERIKLFRNWFSYYSRIAIEHVGSVNKQSGEFPNNSPS